jgi:AcrR family transcriptional regulator
LGAYLFKAICTGAEVSRSTFYTYYDDQYDLLADIQNETFNNVDIEYRKHMLEPGRRENSNAYEEWLRHVADNHNSLQVLLSENGDINFQKKLIEERIMEIGNMVKRINKSADEETNRVYSVVLAQGLLSLIQDWIKHGMDIPLPKMAKLCNRLMNNFAVGRGNLLLPPITPVISQFHSSIFQVFLLEQIAL